MHVPERRCGRDGPDAGRERRFVRTGEPAQHDGSLAQLEALRRDPFQLCKQVARHGPFETTTPAHRNERASFGRRTRLAAS